MTLRAALRLASQRLEEAAVPAPRLDAEVLLCHLLGHDRSWLYAHFDCTLDPDRLDRFWDLIAERAAGKPAPYITGTREFYGRTFLVTPDVLIPRPETEHLVEAALALALPEARILDAGCGSGAIAVTLSLEIGRAVWGTDLSPAALAVAAENARRLGARVHLLACDWTSAIRNASLDLLVSNPPYVPEAERHGLQREIRDYEPPLALFAGPDGLDAYRGLLADAPRVLKPGGWLLVELSYRALDSVRAMLGPGWSDIRITHDLAGWPRVLAARWSGVSP